MESAAAAKVAMYQQDGERFRRMLRAAEEYTSAQERFARVHRVLLENPEEAMRIAKRCYGAPESAPPISHQ